MVNSTRGLHAGEGSVGELAFLCRSLILTALPHSDPGPIAAWTRLHGTERLVMRQMLLGEDGEPLGYPYGATSRLLLLWIATEAVRTRSPMLRLGDNLSAFVRAVGLNPRSGGGPRGANARIKKHLRLLLGTAIAFHRVESHGHQESIQVLPVTDSAHLWWTPQEIAWTPNAPLALPESWILLGEGFYKALLERPVPLNASVLRQLKRSPFNLDLYCWASYAAFQATRRGQPQVHSWKSLQDQLGASYSTARDFRRAILRALEALGRAAPEIPSQQVDGGIRILPTR